jgi:protein ImuA
MDVVIDNKEKNNAFEALKARIRQIERGGGAQNMESRGNWGRTLPLLPEIDRLWPEQGLPLGCLHEARSDTDGRGGPAGFGIVTAFAAALAGRIGEEKRPTLWCGRFGGLDVYGPGLAQVGLPPSRLILASARSDADILAAMEEGLRHPVLGCVVGEVGKISLTASRRLQLAAEKSGVTALVLRTPQRKAADVSAEPLAAASRWKIGPYPSTPHVIPEAGKPRWQLELLQARSGATGQWIVEVPDAQGHFRLSSAVADGIAAPAFAETRRVAAG